MARTHADHVSVAPPEFQPEEPPTFREVMAYLDGVAYALTATRAAERPVSLVACGDSPASRLAPCSAAPGIARPSGNDWSCGEPRCVPLPEGTPRVTLRYGELSIAIDRVPAMGRSELAHAASLRRGGARVIDFGQTDGGAEPAVPYRDTLPYGIATVSLAPSSSPSILRAQRVLHLPPAASILHGRSEEDEVRNSDVYLRCARLSPEWYDLTGADGKGSPP